MITLENMNKDQRHKLLKLNQKLLETEFLMRNEKKKIEKYLSERIVNHDWFNNNFNIRFSLEFYSDDDIITTIDYYIGDEKTIGKNNNIRNINDIDYSDQKEFHCYLYHQLCELTDISFKKNMWEKILKITNIGVFSTVSYENIFNIKENII